MEQNKEELYAIETPETMGDGEVAAAIAVNPNDLKPTLGTIVRTACFFVSWLNALLAMIGLPQLELGEDIIQMVVVGLYATGTALFVFGSSVINWWKNQSFTKGALLGDVAMDVYNEEKR